MYYSEETLHWNGEEIQIKDLPIDPRNRTVSHVERRAIRYAYIVHSYEPADIVKAFCLKDRTVRNLIHKSNWFKVRERLEQKLIQKAFEANETEFREVIGLATLNIKSFLIKALKDGTSAGFKGAKLASDIASNYWRLYQVIQGRPADIKRFENASETDVEKLMQEVADGLKEDPMFADAPKKEDGKLLH